ncbi:hypothetical protein CBR_g19643 [Chara braunii]|uniref:Uncharacterized protein n=1 Tax=Chara braunii TaxID=69332 RepID=A0A388KYJ0_CHABU|nr:hypothetical protein CBR_g19643 [Chara braunii]|eukprot:GBG75130.1 hypothetical protein CBR_g19643 [Chara braunii]
MEQPRPLRPDMTPHRVLVQCREHQKEASAAAGMSILGAKVRSSLDREQSTPRGPRRVSFAPSVTFDTEFHPRTGQQAERRPAEPVVTAATPARMSIQSAKGQSDEDRVKLNPRRVSFAPDTNFNDAPNSTLQVQKRLAGTPIVRNASLGGNAWRLTLLSSDPLISSECLTPSRGIGGKPPPPVVTPSSSIARKNVFVSESPSCTQQQGSGVTVCPRIAAKSTPHSRGCLTETSVLSPPGRMTISKTREVLEGAVVDLNAPTASAYTPLRCRTESEMNSDGRVRCSLSGSGSGFRLSAERYDVAGMKASCVAIGGAASWQPAEYKMEMIRACSLFSSPVRSPGAADDQKELSERIKALNLSASRVRLPSEPAEIASPARRSLKQTKAKVETFRTNGKSESKSTKGRALLSPLASRARHVSHSEKPAGHATTSGTKPPRPSILSSSVPERNPLPCRLSISRRSSCYSSSGFDPMASAPRTSRMGAHARMGDRGDAQHIEDVDFLTHRESIADAEEVGRRTKVSGDCDGVGRSRRALARSLSADFGGCGVVKGGSGHASKGGGEKEDTAEDGSGIEQPGQVMERLSVLENERRGGGGEEKRSGQEKGEKAGGYEGAAESVPCESSEGEAHDARSEEQEEEEEGVTLTFGGLTFTKRKLERLLAAVAAPRARVVELRRDCSADAAVGTISESCTPSLQMIADGNAEAEKQSAPEAEEDQLADFSDASANEGMPLCANPLNAGGVEAEPAVELGLDHKEPRCSGSQCRASHCYASPSDASSPPASEKDADGFRLGRASGIMMPPDDSQGTDAEDIVGAVAHADGTRSMGGGSSLGSREHVRNTAAGSQPECGENNRGREGINALENLIDSICRSNRKHEQELRSVLYKLVRS